MQTQLIEKEAIRAKFSVSVSAQDVDKAFEQTLRTIARQVKVPGFRPGKAPRGVLEAKVGKDAIAEEVRDHLVETFYPKAVEQLELTPIHAHFHAHHPNEGQDYTFEVEVELVPEITLPDLSEIVIDTDIQQVTDAMVEEAIDSLRLENATLVPVERPVEAGDYVMVSLGEGEDAGSMPIDLDKVSPQLAEQLIGKSIGEQVELKLGGAQEDEEEDEDDVLGEGADEVQAEAADTAEDDAAEDAAEDDAAEDDEPEVPALKITIQDIKAKEKPEADDEFAKTLGFDTWAEAEARIRKSLQAQLHQEGFEAQREEFVDKLMAETNFDLPRSLVNRRKRNLVENFAQELQAQNMTLEAYLKDLDEKGNRQSFEQELEEAAMNGVKRDLVLEQLLEERKTEVSTDEFNAALRYMAQHQGKDVNKLRGELGRDGLANYQFLLARDKAVREVVRELTGATEDLEESGEDAGDASEEVPAEAASE
jgi:trigger factor